MSEAMSDEEDFEDFLNERLEGDDIGDDLNVHDDEDVEKLLSEVDDVLEDEPKITVKKNEPVKSSSTNEDSKSETTSASPPVVTPSSPVKPTAVSSPPTSTPSKPVTPSNEVVLQFWNDGEVDDEEDARQEFEQNMKLAKILKRRKSSAKKPKQKQQQNIENSAQVNQQQRQQMIDKVKIADLEKKLQIRNERLSLAKQRWKQERSTFLVLLKEKGIELAPDTDLYNIDNLDVIDDSSENANASLQAFGPSPLVAAAEIISSLVSSFSQPIVEQQQQQPKTATQQAKQTSVQPKDEQPSAPASVIDSFRGWMWGYSSTTPEVPSPSQSTSPRTKSSRQIASDGKKKRRKPRSSSNASDSSTPNNTTTTTPQQQATTTSE